MSNFIFLNWVVFLDIREGNYLCITVRDAFKSNWGYKFLFSLIRNTWRKSLFRKFHTYIDSYRWDNHLNVGLG